MNKQTWDKTERILYRNKPRYLNNKSVLCDVEKMFVKEIAEEMFNQNLWQKDLAELSGVGLSTLSHMLTGKRHITVGTAYKLCEALGMKLVITFVEKKE